LGRVLQLRQRLPPAGEVHRAAGVRVHQAEVPQLRPLVHVGHPPAGQLPHLLRQPLEPAEGRPPAPQPPQGPAGRTVGPLPPARPASPCPSPGSPQLGWPSASLAAFPMSPASRRPRSARRSSSRLPGLTPPGSPSPPDSVSGQAPISVW